MNTAPTPKRAQLLLAEPGRRGALAEALHTVTLEGLRRLTAGLFVFCAAFIVFDSLKVQDHASIPILVTNVILTVTFLALFAAICRGSIPARFANPIAALIALLLTAATLLELSLRSDPSQTGYVLIIATGAGFFVLSLRWLISILGMLVAAWMLAVWPTVSPPEFWQLAVSLIAAAAMSLIVRAARVGSLRRLHSAISAADAEFSERVEAERALAESEEKFRELFLQSASGKFLIALDGTILEANQSACVLLGRARSELVGVSAVSLHPPADIDTALWALRETMERGKVQFDIGFLRKNGPSFTGEVSANLVEVGGQRMIEGAFRDVSERKRGEAIQSVLLHVSQAVGTAGSLYELMAIVHRELGRLVDTTNFYLALYDAESGTYTFPYHVDQYDDTAGDHSQKLEGSLTEYVRRTGEALLVDEEENERLIAAGEVDMVGTPSQIWLGVPLKTAKGVIGVLGLQSYSEDTAYTQQDLGLMMVVSENIALAIEHKRAEEMVRQNEQRLLSLFRAAPTGIGMAVDRVLLQVNERFCEMTGYSEEELIGRSARTLYPSDEEFEYVGREKYAQIRDRGTGTVETSLQCKDGRTIDVLLSSTPLDPDDLSKGVTFTALDISERKAAEEALRVSERKFSSAFRASPTSIVIVSLVDFRLVEVNESFERLTGVTREEAIGKTAVELGIEDPDQLARLAPLAEVLRKGEGIRDVEAKYTSIAGEELFIELSAELVEVADEPCALVVSHDITERRRAQESLRERDVRFRSLVQSTPDAVVVADGEARIVSFNDAAAKIFGYLESEVIGQPLTLLMPERYRDIHRSAHQRFASGNAGRTLQGPVEVPGLRKDGTEFPLEISVTTWSAEGQSYFAGIMRDISERKEAEEELRKKEAQQSVVLNSLPMAFYIARPSGDFGGTWVSHQIGDLAGFSSEEFMADMGLWAANLHPDDKERVLQAFEEMPGEDSIAIEYRWQHADGHYLWILDHGVLLRDERGELREIIGTWLDITERKRAEEELQEKDALLRQAQKMEAVGQLAGGVAHDFNNLLTGITGYAQLALGTLGEECREGEDLRKVLEMSNRAAGLTRQLLAFSRQQSLEPEVINLNSLVDNMLKMLRRLIGENIEVEVLPAQNLDNVRADPGQVEQVLMNLVVNARDAMPGGGRLIIETINTELDGSHCARRPGVSPGQFVMLAVSDTGYGMDEETRRKIFEPFFTTKEKGEGTGLGLATVYGIVKQHGGDISVYSEEGRGTSFKVYLPRVDEEVEGAADDAEVAPSGRGSETVLIVEDEEGVRDVARRTLEIDGYQVLVAATPGEAERLFTENSDDIDLLLTDVVMPGMDGPALHCRLSRNGRSLKVLYMSGYTKAAASYSRVLESGAPFLQKPFTPTQLGQKVLEVLET